MCYCQFSKLACFIDFCFILGIVILCPVHLVKFIEKPVSFTEGIYYLCRFKYDLLSNIWLLSDIYTQMPIAQTKLYLMSFGCLQFESIFNLQGGHFLLSNHYLLLYRYVMSGPVVCVKPTYLFRYALIILESDHQNTTVGTKVVCKCRYDTHLPDIVVTSSHHLRVPHVCTYLPQSHWVRFCITDELVVTY